MSSGNIVFWFRNDLRLNDNPGLSQALESGRRVIPLFIYESNANGDGLGGASKWWMHQSLCKLSESIEEFGGELVLRSGDPASVLKSIIRETGATSVYWNRRYEPANISNDSNLKSQLTESGIEVKTFNGSLLIEPWKVLNKSGNPFKVFTPFWKHCAELLAQQTDRWQATSKPAFSKLGHHEIESESVEDFQLLPSIGWDKSFYEVWDPGEIGAQTRLEHFKFSIQDNYGESRDIPSQDGTSKLSPHLHFGEISPVQIVKYLNESSAGKSLFLSKYITEIGWREFSYYILYHFPHSLSEEFRPQFRSFPWIEDPQSLSRWQKGMTGYPIVDAGMRELWATGYMHNRVRMIAASFLVKHLLIHWKNGAEWFMDTLVDADLASNTMGWQWVAGCGTDAAPYFRIFNPVTQGEKFDPDGHYVRKWVPELKDTSSKYIHRPWELYQAHLSSKYPAPIVDHAFARQRALDAYQEIRD